VFSQVPDTHRRFSSSNAVWYPPLPGKAQTKAQADPLWDEEEKNTGGLNGVVHQKSHGKAFAG
jgi:hypothetical protein